MLRDNENDELEEQLGDKEKRKRTPEEQEMEMLKRLRDQHKGMWITYDDAIVYQERAERLSFNGRQDIGDRRELRIELQNKFGITEIEAINILDGNHLLEIVRKYYRIRYLVPLIRNRNNSKKSVMMR